MTHPETLAPSGETRSPTAIRHVVLTVVTIMSILLYLDRFAVSIAAEYIREDLRMTQTSMAWFISLFFWSYALFQVPAGWLSDRFGARTMLAVYILAWSAFTGLMGLANAVWMMLALRFLCGITQAGAYPTSAALIPKWYPLSFRGTASSIVGLGGRFGAVLAPILTAWMIVFFVSPKPATNLSTNDVLNEKAFVASFHVDPSVEPTKALDKQRQRFVLDLLDSVSTEQRLAITSAASAASQKTDSATGKNENAADAAAISAAAKELLAALSERLPDATWIRDDLIPEKVAPQARLLVTDRQQGKSLSADDALRLNRFLLEGLFPSTIRKSLGQGWRPTILVYGVVGIFVAFAFWFVTRNSAAEHPWCNDAERQLIRSEDAVVASSTTEANPPFPFRAFLTSISLWGNSMTQFLTNLGWFFVVSSLPRYLGEVHGVSLVTQGVMTGFTSGVGILALFLGGRCTDAAVLRYGLKWGRRLPLVLSRFTAAGGYALCLLLSATVAPGAEKTWLPWLFIVCLCIATMSTDFGMPTVWTYAQDVGGKFTGSVMGWANMWGNLGAAIAPLVYNRCLGETPTLENWNSVFLVCCVAFIFAGLFGLLLDSTKPLTADAQVR